MFNDSTNKSLESGWLSPEGKMHYCDYENHIAYAHVILKSDVPTLEMKGWLHIRKGITFLCSNNKYNLRISIAQARTAIDELGMRVNEEDIASY